MRITRPGMLVYVCNLSIEVEAGRLQIQGHPWLYSKLETNVDLRRPPSKKNKSKQNRTKAKQIKTGSCILWRPAKLDMDRTLCSSGTRRAEGSPCLHGCVNLA